MLSGAGLYALMSFTVSQRTREIGIRTAIGARPGRIVVAIACPAPSSRTAVEALLTPASKHATLLPSQLASPQQEYSMKPRAAPVSVSLAILAAFPLFGQQS